jgi:hypothetical protein
MIPTFTKKNWKQLHAWLCYLIDEQMQGIEIAKNPAFVVAAKTKITRLERLDSKVRKMMEGKGPLNR